MDGNLEKLVVEEIYNINIADSIQTNYSDIKTIYLKFFYDYNNDNNYLKDLCILTQINNNHYNLLFDKNHKCYMNNKKELLFNINSINKSSIDITIN